MAKTQSTSPLGGLTRGKAVLIGVLAIALVAVLYRQYGSSGNEEDGDSAPTASSQTPAPRPARVVAKNTATPNFQSDSDTQAALLEFDQAKWQSPELPVVIAYDPFALPAAFPQPPKVSDDPQAADESTSEATPEPTAKDLADALEELRGQLDDLQKRGVQVIIGQNDQYVAMIGDRTIHVGDEINGFTVTEIDPTGVRVERKDSQ